MIKEDIQKEMKVSSEEEAEALQAYEDLLSESQATVNALDEKIVSLGQDIANKMKEIADLSAVKENKAASESATNDYLADLGPNCEWVDKHFDSRMCKRSSRSSTTRRRPSKGRSCSATSDTRPLRTA